ncbi:MAG: Alanine racemase [Candidatus Azambacteria bacterium GW2011_GWA2_39_10]|uniref:Alanine racemase n=1 Tax=Candidatus Azambacteria bacterium GW2011_GWA2_39_10 TaxID=1618611 RepID=A0A0G0LNG8_9BACT|nr:MAG: Alanine racemase [Candidatus Azambacteria bacterium GW2011_GWA2_39_10]
MNLKNTLRTWIEVDKKAIFHNISEFRKLIKPQVKLMAVIKSNAYGHGLVDFAKTAENKVDWFGVDSITEGLKLRQKGLKKPILVLGYTLPSRVGDAVKNNISLTVSTLDALKNLAILKSRPKIHLKIDTGMHRQGFFVKDLPMVIKLLKQSKLFPEGLYTHLAAAKDRLYPSYSFKQIEDFKKADELFKKSGYDGYLSHVAASAGAMLYPKSHFDMVRIGIGLFGMYPTKESEIQTGIKLKPALVWKSIIGEIKSAPKDAYIGYDLTEKTLKLSRLAIVPIGYWHGFDRGFSSCGEVLIKGARCKVLGRVNMDMTVIDITEIKNPAYAKASAGKQKLKVKIGDEVIIIGKQGKEKITAEDMAMKIDTTNYEIVTRINPLIKRFYV